MPNGRFSNKAVMGWIWEVLKILVATFASAWMAASVMVIRLDERSAQSTKDNDRLNADLRELRNAVQRSREEDLSRQLQLLKDCRR
jgi:hypothetical protein